MDKLISLQRAIDAVHKNYDTILDFTSDGKTISSSIEDILSELPSAEPERKTGHWVEIGDEPYDEWECDVCGFAIDGSGCIDPEEYRDVYRFCPNCGADMRPTERRNEWMI